MCICVNKFVLSHQVMIICYSNNRKWIHPSRKCYLSAGILFWKPSCPLCGKKLSKNWRRIHGWRCYLSSLVSRAWHNTLLYLPVMWGNVFFPKPLACSLSWIYVTANKKYWLVYSFNIFLASEICNINKVFH